MGRRHRTARAAAACTAAVRREADAERSCWLCGRKGWRAMGPTRCANSQLTHLASCRLRSTAGGSHSRAQAGPCRHAHWPGMSAPVPARPRVTPVSVSRGYKVFVLCLAGGGGSSATVFKSGWRLEWSSGRAARRRAPDCQLRTAGCASCRGYVGTPPPLQYGQLYSYGRSGHSTCT